MIVEFKTFREAATSYLGITRDFACEGFSFESQDFDCEPGEKLEFKFKHSETNQFVSALGAIVWKEKSSEFGYLIGIRFMEVYNATKSKMLEIISSIGHIPSDYFNDGIDESELSDEEFLLAVHHQTPEVSIGEDILQTGTGQAACCASSRSKRDRRRKSRSNIPLVLVGAIFIISISATPISVNSHKLFENHGSIYKHKVPRHDIAVKETVQAVDNAPVRNSNYAIQVGAWKNPDYANEILPQLQDNYPDSYIVVENRFNIIRIPGIKSRAEGNSIVEEMKDRFNLTSILIRSKQSENN